jgi:hypothetical protein
MNSISVEPIVGINVGFEIHENVEAMKEGETMGNITLIMINLFIFRINILY